MNITPGSESQSITIPLIDLTTNGPATGLTVTTLDFVYIRTGEAAVRTTVTGVLGDVADPWAVNEAIEISAANAPGDYRFDLPNVAYVANSSGVELRVLNSAGLLIGRKSIALASVVTDAASRTASKATGFSMHSVADVVNAMLVSANSFKATGFSTHDAAAVWDLAGKIDGKTPKEAFQIIAAAIAGILSGAGTGTEAMKGLDGTTTRVTGTTDALGNRTGVTYP